MYYFSPQEAARTLQNRQRNGMREEVAERWKKKGWPMPPDVNGNDCLISVLSRHVATARYEDIAFVAISNQEGLHPAWIEYTSDKFVTASPYKRSLLHPTFCEGKGKQGGWKTKKVKLASMNSWDGRPLNTITFAFSANNSSESGLVEYHHALHQDFFPNGVRVDFSRWLSSFGGSKEYYPAYLSLFLSHYLLLEDYHGGETGPGLGQFTRDIFLPSWDKVVAEWNGMRPIIVRMPWTEGMQYYPADHNWQKHGILDDIRF